MDCLVCNTRSAVESCAICHTLLCEVCAAKCEMCGKQVCPEHVHKTHSGRNVCLPCQEKRVAARHGREAGAQKPEKDAEAAAAAAAGAQEQEAEWEVLTESVRKPPPPWKLSLYVACAGVALAILLFIFPSLCRIMLPGGRYLPTSYALLIVPAMALFWGVVGMFGKEYQGDRPRCFIGMGVALLAAVLLIGTVFADPARRAEVEAARMQNQRNNMTPEQLKQWREGVFQKYQQ
jgi:hypothetical protein